MWMSYARLHDIFTAYIDVYIYVGRRTVLQDDDRNTHEQNLSGHLPQALALTKHTHTHITLTAVEKNQTQSIGLRVQVLVSNAFLLLLLFLSVNQKMDLIKESMQQVDQSVCFGVGNNSVFSIGISMDIRSKWIIIYFYAFFSNVPSVGRGWLMTHPPFHNAVIIQNILEFSIIVTNGKPVIFSLTDYSATHWPVTTVYTSVTTIFTVAHAVWLLRFARRRRIESSWRTARTTTPQ